MGSSFPPGSRRRLIAVLPGEPRDQARGLRDHGGPLPPSGRQRPFSGPAVRGAAVQPAVRGPGAVARGGVGHRRGGRPLRPQRRVPHPAGGLHEGASPR